MTSMRHSLTLCLALGLLISGCKDPGTAAKDQPVPATTTTPDTTAGAQDERWGVDSLLSVMWPVQGKVIADLYDGDGIYAWKLLESGARVLVIDDDPAKVAALEARKKQEGIGDDRLIIRLAKPGEPGLLPNEADEALITREFSALGDRAAWFSKLKMGIKPPYKFFLVNYVPFQTPYGPPVSQRMNYNTVADELTAFGFGDIAIFYKKMRYRYIIIGAVPPEATE